MSAIKGFIYNNKKNIIFISLIIISFILMLASNKTAIKRLKKSGFSIIYPFQFVVNSCGSFFQNTFNSISELKKSQEELEKIRNELNQYKKFILDFNELNNENMSLRKLLRLKKEIIYESVACEVIGRDPKTLFDVLIINKGSKDGVNENMPVISYAGGKRILIGKIAEATPFASKVISMHNPKLRVGAVIVKNRVHTLIQGSNKAPGIVKLFYIPKKYMLSKSGMNYIYTSGDSLIFPKGIEIGKIIKIYPSKRYEMFNEADVQISADLSKLEYVLVLKIDYKRDDFKLLKLYNGF